MRYGTHFTETEILLGVINNEIPYADNLLKGMTMYELHSLANAAETLRRIALKETANRVPGSSGVPALLGYCTNCGIDLYDRYDHCPSCGEQSPLK